VTRDAGDALVRRSLGTSTATALLVGEVVGVGIFLTPAAMAKGLRSPLLVLVVWLVMGAAALCGALCYGELAARFPSAGGGYVYLREAYGRGVAFVYGWKCLLVMDPGLTAALATGLAAYVVTLAPGLPARAVALATILIAALANACGVRLAASLGRALTFAKVGLLALIVVWGFAGGRGDASHFLPLLARRAGSTPLVPALAGALIAAFFSFGGWWDLGKLAGEVRDPQRTLPRALASGIVIVTLLYILTSAVFIHLVPVEAVVSDETFAAQAGAALFGARGGQVLSLVVVLCVGSSLLAFMTAAPRVYYAMARDGLAVGALGAVHARTGAPVRAIALQAALASALVLLGRFDQIVAYFVFVTVAFLAASVAGLFVLRRRDAVVAAYSTPAFPWPAWGFLGVVGVVLVLLGVGRPAQAALGVAVTALGIPVYLWLQRRSGR
jgi:APA family basic amino acid/polyamine antiporter